MGSVRAAAGAQIRTGKSGWTANSRMAVQSYRSLLKPTWISRREQLIDERCSASVTISARPPRASWIAGAVDVRPRNISFASRNQFTPLKGHSGDEMKQVSSRNDRSLSLSPALIGVIDAIGSPQRPFRLSQRLSKPMPDGREKLLRFAAVRDRTCLLCTTIYRSIAAGKFPPFQADQRWPCCLVTKAASTLGSITRWATVHRLR